MRNAEYATRRAVGMIWPPVENVLSKKALQVLAQTSSVDWLSCNNSIQNLEFDIANWLVTQGSFPSAPLETLHATP